MKMENQRIHLRDADNFPTENSGSAAKVVV